MFTAGTMASEYGWISPERKLTEGYRSLEITFDGLFGGHCRHVSTVQSS